MLVLIDWFKTAMYIIEGYTKWLIDIIRGEASPKAMKRFKICKECEHNKKGICELCGCILKSKVRVDFDIDEEGKSIDGCPERKW